MIDGTPGREVQLPERHRVERPHVRQDDDDAIPGITAEPMGGVLREGGVSEVATESGQDRDALPANRGALESPERAESQVVSLGEKWCEQGGLLTVTGGRPGRI